MFPSRRIAKELLRRHDHPDHQADESIAHSSYDMIDPDSQLAEEAEAASLPRNRFWTLKRREPSVLRPETANRGIESRRVVSEPVIQERRGISVLRRFRMGKGNQEVEDEGDITISTETDASFGVDVQPEFPPGPVPEDYPQARYRSQEDSFPSFISFPSSSPTTSSQGSPPSLPRRHPAFQRPRPRNPTPASAGMRSAVSVSDMPPLDPMENNFARATAIREITLETRIPTALHDISLSSGDNTFNTSDLADTITTTEESYTSPHSNSADDGSSEYPSYIDSSSSAGGILRARNSRAPPNTPSPTVRFEESPRATYIRRKAIESESSAQIASSLPGARYNASRRWARLGKIMERLERNGSPSEGEPDDGEENVSSRYASPTSFTDPPFPETPARIIASRTFSSSDSPISFARFDPPDQMCSTPLPKFRFPLPPNRYSSQTDRSPLALAPSPDTSSSGLSGDVSSQSWSRRYMSDDDQGEETLEDCSALEALLEYGSSSGSDGEDEGKLDSTGAFDVKKREYAEGSGSRRGSADLLPLKFKGLSMKVDEDPFPFAGKLRF